MRNCGSFIATVFLVALAMAPAGANPDSVGVENEMLPQVPAKFTIGGDVHVFSRIDQKPIYGADITAAQGPGTNYEETFSRIRLTGGKIHPSAYP